MRRSGDLDGVLAAVDLLPASLRDDSAILVQKAVALRKLNRLDAADETLGRVLERDPLRSDGWVQAGLLRSRRGRRHEMSPFLDRMIESLPDAPETFVHAAAIARRGDQFRRAESLIAETLSVRFARSDRSILAAARVLLAMGQEGRVVRLLDGPGFAEPRLRERADALRSRALDQLRAAGGPGRFASVRETDRAYIIAIDSVLSLRRRVGSAPNRGLAIVIPSLHPGGAQTQTVGLVQEVSRERPVVVLLSGPSREHFDFFADQVAGAATIDRAAGSAVDIRTLVPPAVADQLGVLSPAALTRIAFLVQRLRVHRPEVVLAMSFTYGIETVLAASLAGVPRVVVSARGDVPAADGRRAHFDVPVYRHALAKNDVSLVTNSAATARAYSKWLGFDPSAIRAIPNGIAVDGRRLQHDPATTAVYRRSLGIPDDARIVGSAFTFRRVKRPELWLEAAALIAERAPDVAFVLLGAGSDDVRAAGVIPPELKTRLHLPGVNADVGNWLGMMDVVLMTSRAEGTPNTLLEAQALGKPVVATAVGGVAETFLDGETGVLLRAHPSAEEVADAVLRVLSDPGYAMRARARGPRFVRERFGTERMAAEFLDVCFPAMERAGIEPATSGLQSRRSPS